jgi:hypothetical protein
MKKKFFIIVCFLVALTTGSVMATNSLDNVSVPKITYSINLGDVSEMSGAEIDYFLDNALLNIDPEMANELQCKVSVEINVGIIKVTGEVSGDCSKVAAAAKKLAEELKKAFT